MEEVAQKRKHSLYGGSGRKRWKNCVPSVKLSIPYMKEEVALLTPQEIVLAISEDRLMNAPDRITAAFEGSLGHAVLELCLLKKTNLAALKGKFPKILSADLLDSVQKVLDEVRFILQRDPKHTLLVEPEFQLAEDAWGSADIVIILWTLKEVHVIDFKTGKGEWVEADENEQLMYYGAGVATTRNDIPDDFRWHLSIAQPRLPAEDGTWWRTDPRPLTTVDMVKEHRLIQAEIEAAKRGEGPFVPGSYCRHCPGAVACPEQSRIALETARNEFLPVTRVEDAPALFGVSLGELLKRLDAVEEWAKRVREYAYRQAEEGNPPDGWKLVQKRAMRKWRDDVQDILADALQAGLGLPEEVVYEERKIRSVTQIEEHAKKAKVFLDKEKLGKLYESRSSGYNLVTEDKPGEPVTRGNPLVEFTAVSTEKKLSDEELLALI